MTPADHPTPAAPTPAPAPTPAAPPTTPAAPADPLPAARPDDHLDPERGPGLGCFRLQVVLLLVLLVLTPMTVGWGWPPAVSAVLLFVVLILLLFTGQTAIYLLRIVAADRRDGRRHRPVASPTPTAGELEDAEPTADPGPGTEPRTATPADPGTTGPGVRE
jgi:hypothetical protein